MPASLDLHTTIRNKLIVFITFMLSFSLVILSSLVDRPNKITTNLAALLGDVNSDGFIDIIDFQLLSNTYGKAVGQAGYDGRANFNGDTTVDILDFQILSNNYGKVSTTGTITPTPVVGGSFTYKNLTNPQRTEVFNGSGAKVATFTNNSYTVSLLGPSRTFSESSTPHVVTHTTWVRTLPSPFTGSVNETWLTSALADKSPDIIGLFHQYTPGAPPISNQSGLQIAGDASYGPLVNGVRQEGADFNDYLGVNWVYPDGTTDPAESNQIKSMDCSGYIRMVFGYRAGLPMSINPKSGTTIPRRSFEIFAGSPGVIIIPNTGIKPTNYDSIQVGDLVFFDSDSGDGTQIDHAGMFLGKDSGGHYRFISSRKSADGPTIGDLSGTSTLDGTGYFPNGFRSVRRL